jgi:hypothetical protein
VTWPVIVFASLCANISESSSSHTAFINSHQTYQEIRRLSPPTAIAALRGIMSSFNDESNNLGNNPGLAAGSAKPSTLWATIQGLPPVI